VRAEFGELETWSISFLSQFIAVLRDAANRHSDPARRVSAATDLLELIAPARERIERLAAAGDARPLMVVARTEWVLSSAYQYVNNPVKASQHLNRASVLVRKALTLAPSSDAWLTQLRIHQKRAEEAETLLDDYGGRSTVADAAMAEALKRCDQWLKERAQWTSRDGYLALYAHTIRWAAEGSLVRQAEHITADWTDLRWEYQLPILTELYRERAKKLDAVVRRAGQLTDVYIERTHNEVQYRMAIARHAKKHEFDEDSALQHFRQAHLLWPDSPILIAAEARLRRYLWHLETAVALYRRAIALENDGDRRRTAIMGIAEALITQAQRDDALPSAPGRQTRYELLGEARTYLDEVRQYSYVADDVAMLWDRVQYELGEEIDWQALLDAFELIIGDVDEFLHTVVAHIGTLRIQHVGPPTGMADSVLANWTTPRSLRPMAQLFTRRAENSEGEEAVSFYRRAYAVLQACAILEKAWFARELATTSYHRARVVYQAAIVTGTPQPFNARNEGKPSLLHLAEARSAAAAHEAVGSFHREASLLQGRIAVLRKRLQ
jgi:hypothetical protein